MTLETQIADLQRQIDSLKTQVLKLSNQANNHNVTAKPVPAAKKDLGLARFRELQESV